MARVGGVAAFGEELRRQREERGMALETICHATKVSAKHIRALEEGAFAELPGGVFRRGFVRSYLSVLGLEEGSWMRRFEECCRESGVYEPAETDWAAFAENVKRNRGVSRRRKSLRRLGIAAILVVLGVAGWCGWKLARHRSVIPPIPVWKGLKSWVDNAPSR